MLVLLLAMAQAAVSAPPDAIDRTVQRPCETQEQAKSEIVVCGRRSGDLGPYRIKELPPRQSGIPKAAVQLADGVSASADASQADVGGFPSNRLMVGLKIKF